MPQYRVNHGSKWFFDTYGIFYNNIQYLPGFVRQAIEGAVGISNPPFTTVNSLNFENDVDCEDEDCIFDITDNAAANSSNITGPMTDSLNVRNSVKGKHKNSKFSITRNASPKTN